jgi:glycosyltransferase involved in cell wall biosynthesis
MRKEKLNIAILSPSQNAYSETFIQAHKNLLDGNVFYYYGALSNLTLEGKGSVLKGLKRYFFKSIDKLKRKPFAAEKKALVNSLKSNKIDVILAEYGTTAAMYLEAIKKSKLPLIIHFHGYDASKYQILKTYKERYKEMFVYSSFVIAVSQVMYNKLLSLGCPKEKLIKNTYGPNDIFFKNVPTFSKQQFIAIGRFTNKKAPYYTLLAFKQVLSSYPKAKLIMAGVGSLLNTCENLVKYYQIENAVEFVGVITPQEFLRYLESSLAFVQHSITAKDGDMEGTPLAILESSAAGLPVVSTIHAGIPDVIIHDKTGFLVKEHDVDEMSKYMTRLLLNNELARTMGKNNRKNIAKLFSMKMHIDKINELLQKAVKN